MSRQELEGARARLKMKDMDLTTRANDKMKSIKHVLATSAITPLADIDIPAVKDLGGDLYELYLEHKELLDQIKEIEKELNG